MEPWLEHFARASFQRSADTAHDLKTPLNVAVLNLELLRMRLRKVGAGEDEKVVGYTRAIEVELRRLGHIFDAFFLLSTPPKGAGEPTGLDVVPISAEVAVAEGFALRAEGTAVVLAHEPRIRQAYQLFFEGASRLFPERVATAQLDPACYSVTVEGRPDAPDFEPSKIFKFYYSDSDGNPELSLAVARLVTETYGGELSAVQDRDKVVLRLSLPLGAR
jgi:hypothetical protein